jgi:hypothetical protein
MLDRISPPATAFAPSLWKAPIALPAISRFSSPDTTLKNLGVSLIATAPDFFLEETPTAVLVRQVLGAIAQFEKASLVAKLKAARDRKIAQGINGGRKSYAERSPDLVAAAKALQAEQPRLSLRKIADRLRSPGGAPGSAVWESRPATCPAGP